MHAASTWFGFDHLTPTSTGIIAVILPTDVSADMIKLSTGKKARVLDNYGLTDDLILAVCGLSTYLDREATVRIMAWVSAKLSI